MLVPEIEPQTVMPRGRTDHRKRIHHCRATSHPGCILDLALHVMPVAGHRHRAFDLAVVRRGITMGDFDAAGDSHPLLHWHNGKATIDIMDRTIQLWSFGRLQMQVIATFPSQRQVIAEPSGDIRRPCTGRDDHIISRQVIRTLKPDMPSSLVT